MARSVGVHSDAVVTVYMPFDGEHELAWEHFIDSLRETIVGKYQSFYTEGGWRGQEGRVILSNSHAEVVVYEYFGLVSVNLVPRETYDYPSENNLARAWCEKVSDNFRKLLDKTYDTYRIVGRFSNGEAVYQRSEA